jgi:hypothetical protein
LHEIAHQFGVDDGTGCVMNAPPILVPVFCGPQIFTIRDTVTPSNVDSQ